MKKFLVLIVLFVLAGCAAPVNKTVETSYSIPEVIPSITASEVPLQVVEVEITTAAAPVKEVEIVEEEVVAATIFVSEPLVTKIPVAPVVEEIVCHEEDPCWNCATMGNGICGPVEEVVTECPEDWYKFYTGDCVDPADYPATYTPSWDLEPMIEIDPYSGNPIVDCEAQGLATAEDYTCVDPSFWDEPTDMVAPTKPPVITIQEEGKEDGTEN